MAIINKQDITVIFFDLGYTLINFEGEFNRVIFDSYLALAQSLVRLGVAIDTQDFIRRFDKTISDYYRTREIDLIERPVEKYLLQILAESGFNSLPDEIIQTALADMYSVTEDYWQLELDARNTLVTLKDQGYRLGLITNAASASDANTLIDKFNLRNYFEVILISAEEKIRKPDTRIYSRALKQMEVSPDQAVMVGDTLTADILGAQNAGMYGIWIKRRANRPENLNLKIKIEPDVVIDTLEELPSVIKTLD